MNDDIKKIMKKNIKDIYKVFFNPFKIPSNIRLAKIHSRANRIKKKNRENVTEIKRCSCCGLCYQNELIRFFDSNHEFAHLGVSYTLYFHFLVYLSILISYFIWYSFYY